MQPASADEVSYLLLIFLGAVLFRIFPFHGTGEGLCSPHFLSDWFDFHFFHWLWSIFLSFMIVACFAADFCPMSLTSSRGRRAAGESAAVFRLPHSVEFVRFQRVASLTAQGGHAKREFAGGWGWVGGIL